VAEVQQAWKTYKEQSEGASAEDYSRLYESEDRVAVKKAIRRLEEDKK